MHHGYEDVYLEHQVREILTAVALAMLSACVANGGGNVEYERGVYDTVRAQCTAFGIDWQPVEARLRDATERMVEG